MDDGRYYHERAAEALRKADQQALPNVRRKHLAAAEAWEVMAERRDLVKAAADRNAAAKKG